MSIEELLTECEYLDEKCREDLRKAFEFASEAHKGQKRGTGEPYIEHPLSVAQILSKYRLDCSTLIAALLHDVPEDTNYTLQEIEKSFGKPVAKLVDGVTKLSSVRLPKGVTEEKFADEQEVRRIESYRKLFLASADDLRVILIKLADRLHNMRTLVGVKPEKRYRIAKETLEIYAPLADRLLMGQIKGELEDLAFPYVYPNEYQTLVFRTKDMYKEKTAFLNKVKEKLKRELHKAGIASQIHGRSKHLYSLHKKLQKYENDISRIYDLVALRVLVKNVSDCYAALGKIHEMWKPLPGRIKDYIATPKPNGYRSLHTTVFATDGQIVEIQIRTYEMHAAAEYGLAAHWLYSEKKQSQKVPQKMSWVCDLASWQKKIKRKEFSEALKIDFFHDRIFVFSPKGDLFDLPEGATPVDFAYRVHSYLGDHCQGAKVGGKLKQLNEPLKNGDIVEIITNKNAQPRENWLEFVKTSNARQRIRSTLRKRSGGLSNLLKFIKRS